MAHCVISTVVDTDDPTLPASPACMVHTHWAPCHYNGFTANPGVIHTDSPTAETRDRAIESWQLRTHMQRVLVIHRGGFTDTDRPHELGALDTNCWCVPEVHDAHDCGCRERVA